MRKVKIVCTLGPATAGVPRLVELIEAGMDVARLNFSHGEYAAHQAMYDDVRAAARQVGRPITVFADLCGPKIRVGKMQGGQVLLEKGKTVVLQTADFPGTAERIPHTYLPLARDVKPGDPVLLDDGLLQLQVEAVRGDDVLCRVVDGGVLKDKKGMNLPGSALSVPALTEKDKKDIVFGRELGVDWFALSFVKHAADIVEAKSLSGGIPIIAKIEKPEAVQNLEAILEAADAVMVARGDLGVEAGHEKVPLIQKRILRETKLRAKPAITATQMLDSMVKNPRPTRAEVSDVANAVLDGTDAVMLSAETSVGDYPVEAVRFLGMIIDEIERNENYMTAGKERPDVRERTFSSSIADAAAEIAEDLRLAAIAVYTESGHSASLLSAQRPLASIVAFSRHEKVLGRLGLLWGVWPLHGAWVKGVAGVVEQTERELLKHGLASPGDDVVITFGMVMGNEPFQTNVLKLHKLKGA
ncbi:MAG: pyruvate kinase [Deltaproteobacteria bacterium]|nr:pyruvate kinase [Deltaproteobacteria bacterium]